MSRDDEIQYAADNDIPVTVTRENSYSIDQNIWGRSIEAGSLEDPNLEPPEDVFEWTTSVEQAPDEPEYIEIAFEKGVPVKIDGRNMEAVELIQEVTRRAGNHGIGRIDHIENRVVGIKSHEIYEAPGAVVLFAAHKELEDMVLSRDQARFKAMVAPHYANLIYDGFWFSAYHKDLRAYTISSQHFITGSVRMKLHKGHCRVVGRSSPFSLYQYELATYGDQDQFKHQSAEGFIHLLGLQQKTQARIQMKWEGPQLLMGGGNEISE